MFKQIGILGVWMFMALTSAAQQTVTAVASHHYEHPTPDDRIFVGGNYRNTWSMPVTVRVLHLNTEKGGLKITGVGGGMQTNSLHLEDRQGRKWVLRSVDKTVERAMKAVGIKNRRVIRFSKEMLSASMPYGALTVPPMAHALGVISTEPELFYVPDERQLGQYRTRFANTICLLELRAPVLYPGDEVKSTHGMLKAATDTNVYRIDQHLLLQTRLLDMLIGDWDRHADQLKWEFHPQANGTIALYPIPRDHDQAYFNSNGLVVSAGRLFNMHMFVGFRRTMKLTALNYKAWYLDKTFLANLTEEDWRQGIHTFQQKLTDKVLSDAVHRLPPEVYTTTGTQILHLLQHRRNRMSTAAISYYRFLQSHPATIAKAQKKEQTKTERAQKIKAGTNPQSDNE